MALVGSTIIGARELMPDLPQALSVPALVVGNLAASASGGALASGGLFVKITALTPYGETSASPEATVTVVGPTGSVVVTITPVPGATSYRVYYGSVTGGETQYISTTTLSATITSTLTGTAGSPPPVNTAWLPDTDGQYVSAFTIYRWLNDGLKLAGKITGGIPDTTGISTDNNAIIYPLSGQWMKITHGWFEGYPLSLLGKGDTYQRTKVPITVGGGFAQFKQNELNYIEFYPAPASAANATTLTSGVSATATTIPIASTSGLLDHGLAIVDGEMIHYGGLGTLSLVGCIRGIGGTSAASHLTGATITELNARFDGYRMPENYTVGSSASTITVPAAWETLLIDYLLARFRQSEQDYGSSKEMLQTFETELSAWARTNKPLAGPKQIGEPSRIVDSRFGSKMGGGLIIP